MKMLYFMPVVTLLSACGAQQYASPEEFYLSFERDVTCGVPVDVLSERYFEPGPFTDQFLTRVTRDVQRQSTLAQSQCTNWDMDKMLSETEVRFTSNNFGQVYRNLGGYETNTNVGIRVDGDRYVIVVGN